TRHTGCASGHSVVSVGPGAPDTEPSAASAPSLEASSPALEVSTAIAPVPLVRTPPTVASLLVFAVESELASLLLLELSYASLGSGEKHAPHAADANATTQR